MQLSIYQIEPDLRPCEMVRKEPECYKFLCPTTPKHIRELIKKFYDRQIEVLGRKEYLVKSNRKDVVYTITAFTQKWYVKRTCCDQASSSEMLKTMMGILVDRKLIHNGLHRNIT